MLLYLNDSDTDGLEGGETRLWSADGSIHYDVKPRKGRALFFRRGAPDAVLHAGLPVTGDVPFGKKKAITEFGRCSLCFALLRMSSLYPEWKPGG